MPRRIFYGSYHDQKNKNKRKIVTVIVIIAIILIAAAIYFFATDTGGIGQAVRASVGEITQLKMQIQEKDDRIAELEREVEEYKQELALRPAPSATPIPPPNDQVAGGVTVPAASPAATLRPRTGRSTPTKKSTPTPTKAPSPSKTPATVTQPPAVATQAPSAPTAPPAVSAPEGGGETQ